MLIIKGYTGCLRSQPLSPHLPEKRTQILENSEEYTFNPWAEDLFRLKIFDQEAIARFNFKISNGNVGLITDPWKDLSTARIFLIYLPRGGAVFGAINNVSLHYERWGEKDVKISFHSFHLLLAMKNAATSTWLAKNKFSSSEDSRMHSTSPNELKF